MIRIYSDKNSLWVVKDVEDTGSVMVKDLQCFTPDDLRIIALWIEQNNWRQYSGYPIAVIQSNDDIHESSESSTFDYHEPNSIPTESDEDEDSWESSEPVIDEDVCIHGIGWDEKCEDCEQ